MPRLLQFLRETTHALRRFEIAVKKDDAADGVLGQHKSAVGVQLRAVDADHQQLPDFLSGRHAGKNRVRPFLRRHRLYEFGRAFRRRSLRRRPAAAQQA